MPVFWKFSRARPKADESPPSRLYHYLRQSERERTRIHLRLDPDSCGVLIVNASRIYYLNPTAALMARLLLEETPDDQAVEVLCRAYRVRKSQARSDYSSFAIQLSSLLSGACPFHDLELETIPPFSTFPSAPYRLDLALTYRCNNDCTHCYNPPLLLGEGPGVRASPRPVGEGPGVRELSTADWERILDRAWELGIPHVVFTGGEPTLRDDLPELIAHAERNGQISGLNTNARRLAEPEYVNCLVRAGLDHVQITIESCDPEVHNRMVGARAFEQTVRGLKNALATRLFVMTNTTMLRTNVHTIPATLDFLAELGVPTVGLNALIYAGRGKTVGTGLDERELAPLLEVARQKTKANGQRLIWYTPTQYCNFDPIQMELGIKGCTAALYNMCVEPDGGVLPCQSYYHPLGNVLTDDWEAIWNHPLAVRLRMRQDLPPKCHNCLLLAECGGGCPLKFPDLRKPESSIGVPHV